MSMTNGMFASCVTCLVSEVWGLGLGVWFDNSVAHGLGCCYTTTKTV